MSFMPDTTRGKAEERRALGSVLVAACFGLLLLVAVLSLRRGDFSPGEELISPGAEDIAASSEDTTYPNTDSLRFDGGPGVVYVYLRVEDLATKGDFEARVGRSSRTSVLGRLFGGGDLRVVDHDEERLGVSGGGVSGVVKFAVRPESGRRLPPGNYTVTVFAAGTEDSVAVATKYFVVDD